MRENKENHIRNIHKSYIKCPKCDSVLCNSEYLEQHLLKHHVELKCDNCDYVTEDIKTFKKHKKVSDNITINYHCKSFGPMPHNCAKVHV